LSCDRQVSVKICSLIFYFAVKVCEIFGPLNSRFLSVLLIIIGEQS